MWTFWKVVKWTLLVALLIWFALGVNAWRYFSKSGLPGVYYSAVHALDVATLPDPPEIPSVPNGLRQLRDDEVRWLIRDLFNREGTLTFEYIRFDGDEAPAPYVLYTFPGPNIYNSASNIGPTMEGNKGRFVRDDDRICFIATKVFGTICYRIFEDKAGNLVRYKPSRDGSPMRWDPIDLRLDK